MNEIKNFDCVQFQRQVREKMLKEADYDLEKLVRKIKEGLKSNDLYIFLKERKHKQFKSV